MVLTTVNNEDGSREIALQIDCEHPGLIWTVMSFDADIVSWDLPMPDSGPQRHHIKQVATHGNHAHSLTLTLRTAAAAAETEMWIDFVGIEEAGMWPAMKDDASALDRDSIKLFQRLEGESGIGDAVDMCSNGVVAGRFRVSLV